MVRMPSIYIPHGGGPSFFMTGERKSRYQATEDFLRGIQQHLPAKPTAILIITAHWETRIPSFTGGDHPSLIYDYYGFPPHTYSLRYDAPGAPALAERAASLLAAAGLAAGLDPKRGLDHGVFVPLKVIYPDADVPVVELSLDRSLDPALHLAAGRALAPLRDEGVLILGAGMSFHNLRALGDPRALGPSEAFDEWLTDILALPGGARHDALCDWQSAPAARICHPREEHLLPVMVAAGAAEGPGHRIYAENVLQVALSGYRFD